MEKIEIYVGLIHGKMKVAEEKYHKCIDNTEKERLNGYMGGLKDALITSDTVWNWMKK